VFFDVHNIYVGIDVFQAETVVLDIFK